MILRKLKAQIQKLRISLGHLKKKKKNLSLVLEAHLVILKRKSSSSTLGPMLKEWFRNPKYHEVKVQVQSLGPYFEKMIPNPTRH